MKNNSLMVVLGSLVLGGACAEGGREAEVTEIVENLVEAGFPRSDIQLYDGDVYVGRDARVTLEASREMISAAPGQGSQEQYRTTNLVRRDLPTICVRPQVPANIPPATLDILAVGFLDALANYNALNLTFTFVSVGVGESTAHCSALIEAFVTGGTGGSAGFPANGLPFGAINIGSGNASFGADVVEHVITHELGHAVGFRHSDFYNRSISCGGNPVNEGDAGVGAIHIPGTPTTASVGGSLMNSCFRSTETGEFAAADITSLQLGYAR